jgi:hypothetical protein
VDLLRKGIFIFLACAIFLIIDSTSSLAAGFMIKFTIGKSTYEESSQVKTMDATPFIENERTYVPVRYLALALGVSEDGIDWNRTTRAVTITKGNKNIVLTIDSNVASINGESKYLDVTPVIRDARMYLPARFIAEALEYKVDWDGNSRTAIITQSSEVSPPGKLFIARENNKFGYMDATGEIVITPQFRSDYDFSEGLARVTLDDDKNCFINEEGEIVITSDGFQISGDFHDGLAVIVVIVNGKITSGFIDRNGEIVIEPIFTEVNNYFSEGLASVQLEPGGKWGYIDTKGNMVISPQFTYACRFIEGMARVGYGSENGGHGLCGFIDNKGQFIINPQYDSATDFSEGMATVLLKDNYFVIDKTGKEIIKSVTGYKNFSEGLAVEWGTQGLLGYIDTTGKFIIEPKFSRAGDFSEGVAAVRIDGKYGFIDKTGKMMIEPQFTFASNFTGGLAYIANENGTGYIDKSGKLVFYSDSYTGN